MKEKERTHLNLEPISVLVPGGFVFLCGEIITPFSEPSLFVGGVGEVRGRGNSGEDGEIG